MTAWPFSRSVRWCLLCEEIENACYVVAIYSSLDEDGWKFFVQFVGGERRDEDLLV